MSDSIEYYRNQISLTRTEIKNLRQQLSSLKHEHLKEIKAIKTALSSLRCTSCANTATTVVQTQENCEVQASTSSLSNDNVSYKAIGFIETSFQNKRGVPRQPSVMAKARGAIVIDRSVFNNPEHALSGLEEFSHMWIIFHFHCTEGGAPAKVSPPRLRGERRGVLATRAPHRPCPVGLSLVRIDSIEGNRINFLGVDMVNGTPVLDIKPYIPQYDYPPLACDASLAARPPTEGISDVTDGAAGLLVDDDLDDRSPSPRVTLPTLPIEVDTGLTRSPYEHDIPSPYDENLPTPVSPSSESPLSGGLPDHVQVSPMRRPDSERGAPDGQERFTPPQSAQLGSHDGIRVAPWVTDPPSQTYEVNITDDVNTRLNEILGSRAAAFKTNISSLLSADPRSNYVRDRYPDHEYSCVLEDVSLSCIFDASSAVCTIIAVRSAEDMQ